MQAEVDTTFDGFAFDPQDAALPWGLPRIPWSPILQVAALTLGFGAAFWVFATFGSRRSFKIAFALTMMTAILVTPLMQSNQVRAYFETQAARQQELAQSAEPDAMTRAFQAQQAAQQAVLPAHVALNLLAADDKRDSDRDGLTDMQEAALGSSPFNAHSNGTTGLSDLQWAQQAAVNGAFLLADSGADADGDGLTDYQEQMLGTSSSTNLLPETGQMQGVDSDFDGVSDYAEVRGFTFGGVDYYGNPLVGDSNGDGLPDGVEWYVPATTTIRDTDGDGKPDAFDDDNDGDGVPDRYDLSPFSAPSTLFDAQNPLLFSLKNAVQGAYTYAEFQLRPADANYLRYAFNVLDWPYDTQGQMKDLDGATFYDVDPTLPSNPNANGDLKLVPMLEIRTGVNPSGLPVLVSPPPVTVNLQGANTNAIYGQVRITQQGADLHLQYSGLPGGTLIHAIYDGTCGELSASARQVLTPDGSGLAVIANTNMDWLTNQVRRSLVTSFSSDLNQGYACAALPILPKDGTKWIDTPLLANYAINVVPALDGSSLTVYVPLQLTQVKDTDEKVAFYGKMLYQPTVGWGGAHAIRLVWLIQALVDECASDNLAACTKLNDLQVLHTYNGAFTLTGVNVREERGFETAILYEDPTVDDNLYRDDTLMMFSQRMEATFFAGYDCNTVVDNACVGNGVPDFTLTEIQRRFDHATNGSVTADERFGLPNFLSVRRFSYAHADQAIADMAQVQNKAILETAFTPHAGAGNFYPLLLTLGWHRFRSANFENSAQAVLSGRSLDFDLSHSPLVENANMVWQPFEYAAGQWRLLPMSRYWDELGARYAADFVSEPDEDVAAGSVNFVRMYFVALSSGVNRTVQINGAIQTTSYEQTRPPLGLKIVGYAGAGAKFIVDLVYVMAVVDHVNPSLTLSYLGKLGEKLVNLAPGGGKILGLFKMESSAKVWAGRGAVIVGLALLAIVAIAAIITYAISTQYKNNAGWKIVSQIGDTAVTGIVVFLNAVKPAISLIKAFKAGADGFASITDVFGTSVIGAVIALVVNVAMIWGTFFYAWASGAITPDTIAFNSFLALTIAQTLLAVLAFALSLTVWGALLVGIFTAIDAVLSLLCKTFDVKTACFSISGYAAEWVASTFYGATPTFDLTRARLGVVEDLNVSPADPAQGMVHGAQVAIRATVSSSIPQAVTGDPQTIARIAYKASEFFTPNALRRGAVRYSINDKSPVPEGQTYSNPAQPDTMPNAWQVAYYETHVLYISNPGGLGQDRVQFDIYRGQANTTTNTGYATLTAGINSKIPATLYMDYSLPAAECWGNRAAAICNTKFIGNTEIVSLGDLGIVMDVFPATLDEFYNWAALGAQRDRDADGLTSTAFGGLDTDDSNWDQDGDGLSDGKENQLRLQGIGVIWDSPAGFDSDGDGLNDRDELRYGTNPMLADTDYDGLTDKEELDGWLWAYSFDGTSLQTRVTSDPNNADTDGDGNNDALERNIYQAQPLVYRYHPRQVDPAVMTTLTTISDLDGFVGPGQVFTYSVNVGNTTFYTAPFGMEGSIEYTYNGQSLIGIPVLDFETIQANFDNLNAGQTTWVNTPVTVLNGSYANQDLTILSNVTANLYSPNSASSVSWAARPRLQFNPNGHYVTTGAPYFAALTAAPSNWNEPYLSAAVVMNGVQIGGRYVGELHAYALRDTARKLSPIQTGSTPYPLRDSAPAVACADNRCLIVWTAFPDGATYPELHARLLTRGGGTFNPEFQIAPGQNCAQLHPAAASDGVNFAVTWTCGTLVYAAPVSNIQTGNVTAFMSLSDVGAYTHAPRTAITWAGDRYFAAWARRNAENQLDLYGIHLNSDATPYGPSGMIEQPILTSGDNEHLPSVAYNPAANSVLLTYNLSAPATNPADTFCRVRGAILPTTGFSPIATFDISGTICQHYGSSTAYDPRNGNWAVAYVTKNGSAYQTTLQEYNPSGTAILPARTLTYGSLSVNPIKPALACSAIDCAVLTYADVIARPGEKQLFFDRQTLKAQYPHIGAALDSDTVRVRIDTGYPSVAPISGLPANGFVRADSYYIIGGTASDTYSGIEKVEVQLSGGAWQPAEGAATWLYGLTIPATEGAQFIIARATDYAGNTNQRSKILYVDATPPNISSNLADETQLTLSTNAENRFVIPLSGSIYDPNVGSTPTDQTRLTLEINVTPNSSGWHTATLSGGAWTLNYPLAAFDANGETLQDPTAYYTVTVRATDAVGNRTPEAAYLTFNLRVDNTAPQTAWLSPQPGTPVAYLDGLLVTPPTTATYTASLVISGTLVETGTVQTGAAGVQVRFTPLEDPVPPGLWRAQYFSNTTHSGAPLLQRTEDALTFDWGSSAPDSALPADGFSARYTRDILLRASGQYTFTLSKDADSTAAIWVDGIRQLDLAPGATTGTITLTLSLGTHAFVVDYADLGGAANLWWRGNLQAPAWISVAAASPGDAASTWRSAIPAALEGFYRLDLRGSDLQGNLSPLASPPIEAEIDAAAPRIFYEMTYSGLGSSAQTHFTFLATDLNLNEDGLLTPCDLAANSRRTLQTAYTDVYGSGAPRLYQIFAQCSAPGHLLNKPVAQACDTYGQCATADAVNLTAPDARMVYLTLADGSLLEANLHTATQRLVAAGLPGKVTVDRTDGAVFYPDAGAQIFRYAAIYSTTTSAFTDSSLASDYAATSSRMFALDANTLRYMNKDGSASGSLSVQNASSIGVSGGGYAVWVAATMPDGVSGRIYAWNSGLNFSARLESIDPTLYNGWRATSVAHDVQRGQLYLAGWCGDPLMGAGPAPRTAIYGIHRLPAPPLLSSGNVQTNVTGCVPLIRETDPNVTIGRVRVDDLARKIYFARNNSITGEYAVWRAEFDGSLQQLVYVAAQPITDFDFAENRLPQPYPPSAVVRADESVNIRFLAYDTFDNDPLRFSIVTAPQNGSVSAPAPLVTTANETWIEYTPVISYTGRDSFVVQVDDGRGGMAAATVNVTVLPPYLVESSVVSYTTPLTQTSAYGNVTLFATLGEPITLTTRLQAERGLGQLIVRANGSIVTNQILSNALTETLHTVTFYPGAPGLHTLTTELRDAFGKWQTNLYPRTLFVAHEYPQIVVTPTVLTTTHQTWNGWLRIFGTAQSVAGVRYVTVDVAGVGRALNHAPVGDTWQAWANVGLPPDNVTYTVTATIEDALGVPTTTLTTVRADLLPPSEMTLSAGVQGGAGLNVGDTVRDSAPTLTLNWTAASDGAGVSGYYVGWTNSPTPVRSALTFYPVAATHLQSGFVDAQVYYAHVGARDNNGNIRWQTFGPVYLDAPITPDLIDQTGYNDWLNSPGAQLAADYDAYGSSSYQPVQRVYASWNDSTFALAWTGADIYNHTDLYAYLDTGIVGGAVQAWLPGGAPPVTATLPAGFSADYLLRITRDATTLYQWDGAAWGNPQTAGSVAGFRSDFSMWEGDRVIVRIPFSLLGITNPAATTMRLLTLAAERNTAKFWAAAPDKNPLNSLRAADVGAWRANALHTFTFTQQMMFPSLGSGVIPNGGLFRDSNLRLWLTAEPGGLMLGYLDSSRFTQLQPGVPLDADRDGIPDSLTNYTADFVPLADGQTVTYTLHYVNEGTQAAEGVTLDLTYSGALNGGPAVLNLGSLGAGSSGSITFTAQTNNPGNLLGSGEVLAAVRDARHSEYDWLWGMHVTRAAAPSQVTLPGADGSIVRNVTQFTAGSAYDRSGLQAAELRLTYPDASVSIIPCFVSSSKTLAFTCTWNPASVGVHRLEVRVQNVPGVWSDWSAPADVTVDTTAPTLSFDAATLSRLSGLSGGAVMPFSGTATDDLRLGRVQVCLVDTGFVRSCAESLLSGSSVAWSLNVPMPWQRDGGAVNYEAVLYDAAGNGAPMITGTFNFDNQYPTGGVYRTPNQRFYSEFHNQPLPNTPPVCAGTVLDGTPVVVSGFWQGEGISATPITPTLSVTSTFGLLRHDFDIRLPLDRAGTFTVTLTARDSAGNSSALSPCVFDVSPEVDLALQVAAQPTTTLTTNGIVTYTYTITNSDLLTATGAALSIYPGGDANPLDANAALELLAVDGAVCDVTAYGWYSCALPDLGRNAAHEVTFRYLAHVRMPFTNTVNASVIPNGFDVDNTNQFNRTASVTAQFASDLSLGVTGVTTVPYGMGVLTYTVTLTNAGPSPLLAAEGMGATVYFNFSSVDYTVTGSGSGWACSIPPEFGGSLMMCNHPGFPIGTLLPLTLRVDFDPNTLSLSNFSFYSVGSSAYDTSSGNDSVLLTPQVVIESDLAVAAMLTRDSINITEPTTLVMTVTNHGPTPFPSGFLSVGLPDGLGHENDSAGCGGVYTLSCLLDASILPGTSRVFTTDLRVWDANLLHNITLTVPLTVTFNSYGYGTDPNPLNDTAAVALHILPVVNLQVAAQGGFGGVFGYLGVPLTYTLQVENLGPDAATGIITLTHEIPTGLQYQSVSGSGWACTFTGVTLTCNHAALPSGNAAPLSVRVLPQVPGNFTGAVSLTGPDFDSWMGNNITQQKVFINDTADVRLTKTASISEVNPGDALNYILQITNQAATASTAWVVLTDTLPANVTYTGYTASRAFINCAHSSGTVVCDADAGGGSAYTLYAGETWTITLQTQVLAGTGAFTNTAVVTHGNPDPTPADLTASAAVSYAPLPSTADWSVFKSAQTENGSTNGFEIGSKVVAPAAPGEEILYQIGVTHNSSAHPWDFRDIVLTDTLPAGVTFIGWDDTSDFDTCTQSGQIVRCELALLPYSAGMYGTSRHASFYATVPMTMGVYLTNTLSSASLTMTDTNLADNSDYATVQVVNVIDLSLSFLRQTPAALYPGDVFSLTFEAYNWLTQPAGQLRLLYPNTPNLTLLGASTGWVCVAGSSETTCTYAAGLAGETTLPVTLTLQAAAAGTFYPHFILLGAPDDVEVGPWNNENSPLVKVSSLSDLHLTKTANRSSVTPGGLLTYTLTITNLGGGAATGIRLTDTLPAGVQFITYTASLSTSACAYAGGTLTCDVTPSARLLLVDESMFGAADNLRSALDELGLPYTVFNGTPNAATLAAYDAVIWVTAPNPPPSAAGISALQTYLDGGGKLLLIAPGYANAVGGTPDTLMATHLGVAAVSTYSSDYVDNFTGANAFSAAGSINPYDWWADALQPNAQAQVAVMAHHLTGASNPAALYTARTVFFALNWSSLYDTDSTYANALLNAALQHLITPLTTGQSAQISVRVLAPLALGGFTNSAQVSTRSRDSNLLNNLDDLTLTATLLPQSGNGPGGVADTDGEDALVLWLRADQGSGAAPGQPITAWLDQSGYAHNATGGAALLTANFSNAQPALTFSATVPYTLPNFHLDAAYTVFIVARQNGAAQNALLTNLAGNWQFGPANGNDVFTLPGWTFTQTGSSDAAIYMAWQDADGAVFYKNGALLGAGTPTAYPGGVLLGGHGGALSDGNLAEVIVLRGVINSVQRGLIHNYLSAKYAIPLANGDLFPGDDVANGNFDHTVAGIGRAADGTHPLAHSAGLYLMSSGFLQDDGDYLIMGHNGLTGNTVLDLPSGGLWDYGVGRRWMRAWYIAKTDVNSNGGTLTLVFDLSEGGMVGVPLEPASNYRLLKRAALTGAFEEIAIATRIEGDQIIFEGVDAALIGSHFTLGTVDSGSPTAVRLTRFEAVHRAWWQQLWDWLRGR
ncbi:MAG: hypothetical protein OHK0052_00470 [Anaerolineales bacterium]